MSTLFLAITLTACTTTTEKPSTDRPNIILVMTDDQGYGDMSCNENPIVKTPAIDSFAEGAVRFTNFHVGPTCSPTRAGLMTGHYSGYAGVWHTIGGRSMVREREWMLPQAFSENGYATGMFGKWHLGDSYPYRPQDRGFQHVVAHGGGGIGQSPDYWGNDYFDDTYFVNGVPQKFTGYCTDVWFDEALKFIETNKDKPFFCYIPLNAPHSPYSVPKKYYKMYEGQIDSHIARFYGMITHLDERFGQMNEKLHELGLDENTIVIFMTDNGSSCFIGDKNGFPKDGFNAGLRGGKGSPYDGGHRVPVYVRWPKGGINSGRDIDQVTAHADLMPTLLDLCGIQTKDDYEFHGKSIAPLLTEEDPDWQERTLVTESQRVLNPIKWRNSCVMTDQWRLVFGKELYDMTTDREQRKDVAADHPDVVKELRADYEKWFDMVYQNHEQPIPILIGDPANPENEVALHCMDWRYPEKQGDVPWHQGYIRTGKAQTGYWEIDVKQSGKYRIELRRWPRETGLALNADAPDIEDWKRIEIDQTYSWWLRGSKALKFDKAKVTIGELVIEKEVDDSLPAVVIEADLKDGPTTLSADFFGSDDLQTGVYYVYVSQLQ